MPEPVVSVVVPCYQPGQLIEGCVAALLDQDLAEPYEVIVVESSADGTAERLHARFPTCRVIGLRARTAQGEARNLGVAAARGTFIALTDHDCMVGRDWLTRLLARHRAGRYGGVGGAVANGTPRSVIGTAAYWIEFNDFTPGRAAGLVDGVPHCNVCFRREVLVGEDPFPAIRSCAEDLTFNCQLVQRGSAIYFDPTIVVSHLNRTRLHSFIAHQRVLGAGSAVARRLVPLKGSVFVRHPTLTPLLPVIRLVGTLARVARRHPKQLPVMLGILPLLLPGYLAWTLGFLEGRRELLAADAAGTARA